MSTDEIRISILILFLGFIKRVYKSEYPKGNKEGS